MLLVICTLFDAVGFFFFYRFTSPAFGHTKKSFSIEVLVWLAHASSTK